MEPKINVSLEKHLLDSLKAVCHILPEYLRQGLREYVSDPYATLIPYDVLSKISAWSRSEDGRRILKENALDPHSYSIVALLAGTMTSPERKFGNYVPPNDPQVIEAERIQERKAITALANAILSVGGVGVGAYWASDKTGWRNEWRVLFALFAATVVAISEAGLFLIWQRRKSKPPPSINHDFKLNSLHKKVDPPTEAPEGSKTNTSNESRNATLHRRK